jgi:hypothetical protein
MNATNTDAITDIARPISALMIVFLAWAVCSGEPWLVVNIIAAYIITPTATIAASRSNNSITAATTNHISDTCKKVGSHCVFLGRYSYQEGKMPRKVGELHLAVANRIGYILII